MLFIIVQIYRIFNFQIKFKKLDNIHFVDVIKLLKLIFLKMLK